MHTCGSQNIGSVNHSEAEYAAAQALVDLRVPQKAQATKPATDTNNLQETTTVSSLHHSDSFGLQLSQRAERIPVTPLSRSTPSGKSIVQKKQSRSSTRCIWPGSLGAGTRIFGEITLQSLSQGRGRTSDVHVLSTIEGLREKDPAQIRLLLIPILRKRENIEYWSLSWLDFPDKTFFSYDGLHGSEHHLPHLTRSRYWKLLNNELASSVNKVSWRYIPAPFAQKSAESSDCNLLVVIMIVFCFREGRVRDCSLTLEKLKEELTSAGSEKGAKSERRPLEGSIWKAISDVQV